MKWKLPSSLSSPQDFRALVLEIRQYARWFAHASVKQHFSAGSTDQPVPMSAVAVAIIQDWFGEKQIDQAGLDKLIEVLEDFEKSAPRLTITLAAAPSNGLKKSLVEWCRENIGPNVLVDFQFNSTLLGGMVVRWGSHIFDWSFRRQILAGRGRFPEVLRHV